MSPLGTLGFMYMHCLLSLSAPDSVLPKSIATGDGFDGEGLKQHQ